jgi:hypothetical protein
MGSPAPPTASTNVMDPAIYLLLLVWAAVFFSREGRARREERQAQGPAHQTRRPNAHTTTHGKGNDTEPRKGCSLLCRGGQAPLSLLPWRDPIINIAVFRIDLALLAIPQILSGHTNMAQRRDGHCFPRRAGTAAPPADSEGAQQCIMAGGRGGGLGRSRDAVTLTEVTARRIE